jgi:hypothetical protein
MEEIAESQVYRLFLNTETGFQNLLSNSDKANVSWLVDYDSLFNRDNYNYKNCRLRYKLISQESPDIVPTTNTGVIALNGLSSSYVSKNTNMLPLDIITPTMRYIGSGAVTGTIAGTAPSQTTTQTASVWNPRGQLIGDTMGQTGVDIAMPYGLSPFNVQFWLYGFGSRSNADNVLQSLLVDYNLMLQFELYNPK